MFNRTYQFKLIKLNPKTMDQNVESRILQDKFKNTDKDLAYYIKKSKNHRYIVKKWSTFHRFFYRFMNPFMSKIVPNFFRFEYFGIENLTQFPENTPLILAGNHRSHLDALAAFATIFPPVGNLRYLTSITPGDVLKENSLFKMMRYLGGYPINRKNREASLDYLYETLKVNLPIGIFPQGGRIGRTPVEDYQKLSEEGQSGVGRLILRMKNRIPVIPIYLHGTAEALSRGSIIPKFGSYISVTLGEPIFFDEYLDQEWDINSKEFYETARIITDKIMKKIQDLCYDTEKGLFQILENIFNAPINKIRLTESQSKKLRKWLRRFSHYAPYEYASYHEYRKTE